MVKEINRNEYEKKFIHKSNIFKNIQKHISVEEKKKYLKSHRCNKVRNKVLKILIYIFIIIIIIF